MSKYVLFSLWTHTFTKDDDVDHAQASYWHDSLYKHGKSWLMSSDEGSPVKPRDRFAQKLWHLEGLFEGLDCWVNQSEIDHHGNKK